MSVSCRADIPDSCVLTSQTGKNLKYTLFCALMIYVLLETSKKYLDYADCVGVSSIENKAVKLQALYYDNILLPDFRIEMLVTTSYE